ncbi:MAG: phosphatidylinositol-specific phospholipase C/glycerophosphodiester phosphodiesterase family protein [Cyclobacteriaceae bacterium]
MNSKYLLFIAFQFIFSNCSQEILVIQGHAHNDYENKNPLSDALENGFISVEVDVHLIDDNLYVSHDLPQDLDPALTLEDLYLKPLEDRITGNNGSVYPGYSGFFYLMIDFKTSAKPTYKKLKTILSNYLSIISVVKNGVEQNGPIKIFISGNRPIDEVLNDEPKLAGLDGRPEDLTKQIPTSVMPVISDNYSNHLSWNGSGDINEDDKKKLKMLVQDTQAQNKKLRLWAAPDNENAWKFLLDHGVDLINTDHLEGFSVFIESYNASKK